MMQCDQTEQVGFDFDAKMFALARGITVTCLVTIPLTTLLHKIQCIFLITDNQSTAITIANNSCHPAQVTFIIFCNHTDHLLSSHPDTCIEIIWTSGHCGLSENDYADHLAKSATPLSALIHSIILWEQETTKSAALKA